MEEKKITLRVSPELHIQAKRRMLDEVGDDNFQALLHEFLKAYADKSDQVKDYSQSKANPPPAGASLGVDSSPEGYAKVSDLSSTVALVFRLWEVSPADARELCTRLEAQIKALEGRIGKATSGTRVGKRPA